MKTAPPPFVAEMDPVDFWHLRAVCSESDRTVERAKAMAADALASRNQLLAELAKKYQFDAGGDITLDESGGRCRVIQTQRGTLVPIPPVAVERDTVTAGPDTAAGDDAAKLREEITI